MTFIDMDVEEEVARLAAEYPGAKIGLAAPPTRAYYPPVVPDRWGPDDCGLTPGDIEDARNELVGRAGLTYEDIWTLTQAGTLPDQAAAIIALAGQVEAEEDELKLAVSAEERQRRG